MQTKTVFEGRPRLDLALRILMGVAVVILLAAAVVERDLRAGATAAVLASFGTREMFVLSEPVDRFLNIVFWASLALWAFLAFG